MEGKSRAIKVTNFYSHLTIEKVVFSKMMTVTCHLNSTKTEQDD